MGLLVFREQLQQDQKSVMAISCDDLMLFRVMELVRPMVAVHAMFLPGGAVRIWAGGIVSPHQCLLITVRDELVGILMLTVFARYD